MSELKISRNTFLEKEELNRMMRFLSTDSVKALIGNSIKSGGIVPEIDGTLGDNFLIEQGTDHRHIKFKQTSTGYDTQGNRIHYEYEPSVDIAIPYTAGGTKSTWVSVQYNQSNIERGTISLSSNGVVTGIGTYFTEVFRGISTLVQNRIRIYQRTKVTSGVDGYTYVTIGTYEITQVVSNTSLLINVTAALGAGDYVYSVVGAFSPGSYDDSRVEEIYFYDHFSLILSTILPTILTADQYLLAKVTINDLTSTQTIEDLRTNIFRLTDQDIYIRISHILTTLKGGKDSLIISGCESELNFTGTLKTSLDIDTGYVLIEDIIYEVEAHNSVISVVSDLPYWEIYDDSGTDKARVVYAGTKLGGYYDFDQNYRIVKREYRSVWGSNFALKQEDGFLKSLISYNNDSTVGRYQIQINGGLIFESSSANVPDRTKDYIFSTNCRGVSQFTKVITTGVGGATATAVMLSFHDIATGAGELPDSDSAFDLCITKISREEY